MNRALRLKLLNKKVLTVTFLSLILFAYLLRTAWLSDDAMISIRAIMMLFDGHGPVIEKGVRVQGFTHPLWFLLMVISSAITREFIYTPIFLGLIVTMTTFYLIANKLKKISSIILLLVLLISSRALLDFSTSGLENSLSNLLLCLLFFVFFNIIKVKKSRRSLIICMLSCLIILTRLDYLLLVAPLMIYSFRKSPVKEIIKTTLIGFSPAILWHLFSIIYFGTLFPNTAYAKLNVDIATKTKVVQGLKYFYYSAKIDTGSLLIILIALAILIYKIVEKRNTKLATLLASLSLYNLYVVYIGGDFMAGRFLTATIFLSILIIIFQIDSMKNFKAQELQVYLLSCIIFLVTVTTSWGYILQDEEPILKTVENVPISRVINEREYYANYGQSLFIIQKELSSPQVNNFNNFNKTLRLDNTSPNNDGYALAALSNITKKMDANSDKDVNTCGRLGIYLLISTSNIAVTDPCALADPFFARIKYELPENGQWRPGHFIREVPEGYPESTENLTVEEKELLTRSQIITTGKIFTKKRFSAIFKETFHLV